MPKRTSDGDHTGSLWRMLQDKLELERKFGVEVVPMRDAPVTDAAAASSYNASSSVPSPLACPERSRGRGEDKGEGYAFSSPSPSAVSASPSPLGGEGRGEGYAVSSSETNVEISPVTKPSDNASKAERLAALEAEMAGCDRCSLGKTRTNLVFGVGNPEAELMFVGEAPGADEDAQGEPFVGRAGQLLDKIIAAMGFKRSEIYIGNILKCRPPGNRNPNIEEMAHCMPFILRQIRIINPKVIVCLGGIAGNALLGMQEAVGRLRGKFHDLDGFPVLVTYHPAYLLRNAAGKAPVWEDMKKVLHKLGRPVPE